LAKTLGEISAPERRRLREAAVRAGVEICGLHWLLARTEGFHLNHPDTAVRERTGRYLCDLVDCCADLGGKILVLGSPQQRNVLPGLTARQAWDFAAQTLASVVQRAKDQKVVICFEPLSPAETNFINTAAEAIAFARQFNSPAMKIILDVKAMCSEPEPIPSIWGGFIKFSHTIFALPFALASMAVAARDQRGWPGGEFFCSSWRPWFARGLAPCPSIASPTANLTAPIRARPGAICRRRDFAGGRVDAVPGQRGGIGCGGSYWINPLLLSFAGGAVFVCFYSLTKRFTDFTHVFLGWRWRWRRSGAWLAVKGSFDLFPRARLADVMQYSAALPLLLAGRWYFGWSASTSFTRCRITNLTGGTDCTRWWCGGA
jgi:hypothetical protein